MTIEPLIEVPVQEPPLPEFRHRFFGVYAYRRHSGPDVLWRMSMGYESAEEALAVATRDIESIPDTIRVFEIPPYPGANP